MLLIAECVAGVLSTRLSLDEVNAVNVRVSCPLQLSPPNRFCPLFYAPLRPRTSVNEEEEFPARRLSQVLWFGLFVAFRWEARVLLASPSHLRFMGKGGRVLSRNSDDSIVSLQ